MDNFEYVVNSLRASVPNLSIFITGSNSKMLSDELSSDLSGRYVLFKVYPLSYQEYVSYTKKDAYDILKSNLLLPALIGRLHMLNLGDTLMGALLEILTREA